MKIEKSIWHSWSSGKDSAYALFLMQKQKNCTIDRLFTSVTKDYDRVTMHATRSQLLKEQAKSLGIPLEQIFLPARCPNATYSEIMQGFVSQAESRGARTFIYGDIFLEDVRAYRENSHQKTKITPVFPLWKKNSVDLAQTIIADGFKAVITSIDLKALPASFAGREYDQAFLDDLPSNVDPCGENGEFHTFVYHGPNFSFPIEIKKGEGIEREGFYYFDLFI